MTAPDHGALTLRDPGLSDEVIVEAVCGLPGIVTALAFVDDRGGLVVVAEAEQARVDSGAVARGVREALADVCEIPAEEVVLVAPGALSASSPSRSEVRAALRRRELEALYRDRLTPSPRAYEVVERAPAEDEVAERAAARDDAPEDGAEARPATTRSAAPALDAVREAVADALALDAADVGDDDELVGLGMDSMRAMMLADEWQRSGLEVDFAELAERATVRAVHALLAEKAAAPVAPPTVADVDDDAPFDLTPVQHAYWVGRQDGQPLGGVGCHFYVELDGDGAIELDVERLDTAVARLVERHALLRARFLDDGRQQVRHDARWHGATVHDLSSSTEAEAERQCEALRERLSNRRLEVDRGEVFDVQVTLLPDHRHRLHVNFDLLVADVRSIQIILDDLAALYGDGPGALVPIEYSFAQYLAEQEVRRAAAREEAERSWRERIAGLPLAPQLPTRVDPATVHAPRFVRRAYRLSATDREQLAVRSREHGVTLPMALATAYATVLGTWSAEPRFLLNLPLFDRQTIHPDVPRIVADFTGLTLVEVDAGGERSFVDRARDLQSTFQRNAADSAYSGVDVLRQLARKNAPGAGAAPVVFTSALGMGDLISEPVQATFGRHGWMLSQTPQVWLDHQVVEQDGGVLLNWDAVEEVFADGVLDAMFGAFVGVLEWMAAADWDEQVPGLVPDRQLAVREAVNATEREGVSGLVHDGFFEVARRCPERPALLWGEDGAWSYGRLAEAALRVAGGLRAAGVEVGDCVAVTLPKGPEQVAAVLGVLAAGGTYVPVGVQQPPLRRERIYARAGVSAVIGGEADGERVSGVAELFGCEPIGAPVGAGEESLAYVVFTSGSTGEPKGVEVSHRAVLNTILDVRERFGVGGEDRVLAVSSLDFDLSVFDLFGLLGAGGAVVLIDEDQRREAREWVQLIERHAVTVWNTVPALLDMLLVAARAEGSIESLRVALVSGDWVGLDLAERLRALAADARLGALGGATEAAIWSNAFEVDDVDPDWRSVPYGFPLANQRYRVVDERGRDRPDQVPGELWIGGHGVAEGYRGDPDATALRFVRDEQGRRWYRTGDQGRYWPDGTLEFLGRVDYQVKIGGHRIELGEIEHALREHPAVQDAVAVTIGERPAQRLGAVIVGDDAPDEEQLAAFLADRLPAYAIPGRLIARDALPLSANGKVDRKAIIGQLEDDDAGAGSEEPPRPGVERDVAELWAELLDVPDVSRDASFFGLGGDSLLATRLITRLRGEGLQGATLRSLFASPTLAEFAGTLEAGGAPERARRLAADAARRQEPFPPTDVQRAYWIGRRRDFTLGGVGCHFYTELDGEIDVDRLEEAWNRLIARHEMLRAEFLADGRQRILEQVPRFEIAVRDAPGDDADMALAALRGAMSHQLIDATHWPLFDVRAVRYGDRRVRLGISLDNIIIDALSAMIVFNELDRLYADLEVDLEPIDVSFRDYVVGVKPDDAGVAESERYWRERVASLPPGPQLPLRCDPATIEKPYFARRRAALAPAQWQRIAARARAHDLTPSSVLASAFAEVLSGWSERPQLTLNMTLFDRRDVHPHIDRVLGDFTSLLLVAHEPEPGDSWAQRATRLQQQAWRDLAHSDVSAIWVMRELARQRGSADVSMPVVFTSTIGVPRPDDDRAPAVAEPCWGVSQTPQVWLDHQVVEQDGGLSINWDAVEELFADGVLDAMFGAFVDLLGRLAVADWDEPVAGLVPDRQLAVRRAVNATEVAVAPGLVHDRFFEAAGRSPQRPALLFGEDGAWSYGELAHRALCVAGGLRAAGIGVRDLVAVTLPKGPQQVAAVLGVLAAGGTYVPVGVEQPVLRRERIYARAGVTAVVATGDEGDGVLGVDALLASQPLDEPASVDDDTLAYVVFTSGSTGEPKGVEITHRAALNTILDVCERFEVGAEDRVLAVSALDFDLSVYDLFGLLGSGGAVVLIDEDQRREARDWVTSIERHAVTVWNTVPALLDMLLVAARSEGSIDSLRLALVSGDWVGLDLAERLHALVPDARLVALGGATEAAIWSNAYEVDAVDPQWRSVPYGFPLANQRYRVVDDAGADRPDQVPGELWIGGSGVAAGYRGDPEATARQFVHDEHGQRWYRTGDQGRYWPDGTLEFLGRVDHQVKIGGHRIELGEIEHALHEHPAVSAALALTTGERTGRRLAAAIVGDQPLDRDGITRFLRDRLPAYAIPTDLVEIDELPLTANGKIDRNAIAGLVHENGGPRAPAAAQSELESRIAELWAGMLGLPEVGRDDNFVVLGGDSLLATQMVDELERELGVIVSLRDLFTAETVAGLAQVVESGGADGAGAEIEEGVL